MGFAEILTLIDHEILALKKARILLTAGTSTGRKPGRPSNMTAVLDSLISKPAKKRKKRKLFPEGRKKIAEAQKRRWAATRKTAAGAK